jgi:hypothetical protein
VVSQAPAGRFLRLLTALTFFSCGLGWARAGRAYEPSWNECGSDSVWLPAGANVGAAIHPNHGTGLLLGGEASLIALCGGMGIRGLPRGGAYADVLRDQSSKTWRLSAGPEVVVAPFVGVDAGALLELGGPGTRLGMRLRYFAASLVFTPYFGADLFFARESRIALEAGALLKYPILVDD